MRIDDIHVGKRYWMRLGDVSVRSVVVLGKSDSQIVVRLPITRSEWHVEACDIICRDTTDRRSWFRKLFDWLDGKANPKPVNPESIVPYIPAGTVVSFAGAPDEPIGVVAPYSPSRHEFPHNRAALAAQLTLDKMRAAPAVTTD